MAKLLWNYALIASATFLGGGKKKKNKSNLCGYHGNQQVPRMCPGLQEPALTAPMEHGAPRTMGEMLELHPS